jgi:hypothetical protein
MPNSKRPSVLVYNEKRKKFRLIHAAFPSSSNVKGHVRFTAASFKMITFIALTMVHYAPLKCRSTTTRLYRAMSQKTVIFKKNPGLTYNKDENAPQEIKDTVLGDLRRR